MGIKTVRQLQNIPDSKLHQDLQLPQGLTLKTFLNAWDRAQEASKQDSPQVIDHRKALNPYLSRYGENWKKYMMSSPTFSNSALVTDYIEHLMEESSKVMRGTKHETDWMVYHDALSLMTSKENMAWMSEKGFLKRWILPSQDLYVNDKEIQKKYSGKPIGNSPEFMPWDAHLNFDVHCSLDHHCLLSKALDDKDPKKFDASTPKKMKLAYQRILNPDESGVSPTPKRIIQDVRRVQVALRKVVTANGCLVQDAAIRSGRRYEKSSKGENWGGARTKKSHLEYSPPEEMIHKDLWEVRRKENAASVCRATSSQNSDIDIALANEIIMENEKNKEGEMEEQEL